MSVSKLKVVSLRNWQHRLLRSDFIFLMKEVTQRACCLLIDHCAEFFKALHLGVGVLQMFSVQWDFPVPLRYF